MCLLVVLYNYSFYSEVVVSQTPFSYFMKVEEGKSSLHKVFLGLLIMLFPLAVHFLSYSQPSFLLLKIQEFLCNVFNSMFDIEGQKIGI